MTRPKSPQISERPNVLLILSDEHSFRFLGHVPNKDGGENVATPNLDTLASTGTVFANTYCAAPLCVPSRISLLTGKEAQLSGACDNGSFLDPTFDTFPKALGRAGYSTCLVGKMHFKGSNQFHGFQHRPYGDLCGYGSHQYEHVIPLKPGDTQLGNAPGQIPQGPKHALGSYLKTRTKDVGPSKIPESQCVDSIIATESVAFLRDQAARNLAQPWFLCASFIRPHFPLTCPERFLEKYTPDTISEPRVPAQGDSYDHPVSAVIREKFNVDRIEHDEMMRARAAYFANVAYFDEVLGDFLLRLEASDLLENTIVIYTSDHGEMAGEHGTWWKSGWYEACTRVPLIVSTPAQRAGLQPPVKVDTSVSLLDLAPTISALAGGDYLGGSGNDLSDTVMNGTSPLDRPVYCDHLNNRWGPGAAFRSVRLRDFKLVRFHHMPSLFFDLARDPSEQVNIFDTADGDAASVRDHLVKFVDDSLDFDKVLPEQDNRQEKLRNMYPLTSAEYLPNQYTLRSGRIIEADQTMYFQNIVTDTPETFFSDFPEIKDPGGQSQR